jgi:hypothetical protein
MICGCNGAKHIYDPETKLWKRCLCLLKEEHNRKASEAGIPEAYWNYSLSKLTVEDDATQNIVRSLNVYVKAVCEGKAPSILILWGNPVSVKILIYLVTKAVLCSRSARVISMGQIINRMFDKTAKKTELGGSDFLGLFVGDEGGTKNLHQQTLNSILINRIEPRFNTLIGSLESPVTIASKYPDIEYFKLANLQTKIENQITL